MTGHGAKFGRKKEEAIPLFERAANAAKTNLLFWNNLGQVYADSGNFEKAESAINHALSINAGCVPCLEKLADFQSQQRNYAAARATYERLRALVPSSTVYPKLVSEAESHLAKAL